MLNSGLSPAFAQNNVPVALAVSNMFAPYAGVFIQSLLDHADEGNYYDIIILEREISEENKRLLKSLAAGHTNVSIRFYNPSPLFASFHYTNEKHHAPLEVWYKILAPHILGYPGRIITVDVDTLLKTDIARLMDEDLEGRCVGAVSSAPRIYADFLQDCTFFSQTEYAARARDYYPNVLGIEDGSDMESYKNYVNTGLVLYDSDKYVQELDAETILNTGQQRRYFWSDQDVLYLLMKAKIKILDLAWNVVIPLNSREAKKVPAVSEKYNELYNDGEAYQRAYEHPYLLHWAGNPKPWVCPDVTYGSEWWQTALRTPFVGHILARMLDAQETRRAYYRKRYGKEDVDVWDPSPKGIDRT